MRPTATTVFFFGTTTTAFFFVAAGRFAVADLAVFFAAAERAAAFFPRRPASFRFESAVPAVLPGFAAQVPSAEESGVPGTTPDIFAFVLAMART